MSTRFEEPPEYGELELEFPLAPVSLQATRAAKAQFQEQLRTETRKFAYLLDDYVTIDLEWFIHERYRWESDASADVDNIVKPLLDALCGPEGILIDDCLVKSFSSTWFASTSDKQRVLIRIKYDADHYLPKDGLVFVRVDGAMCYPVPIDAQKKALRPWLLALKAAVVGRALIERLAEDYYPARYVLPPGFIHRTRLNQFKVYDYESMLIHGVSENCRRS